MWTSPTPKCTFISMSKSTFLYVDILWCSFEPICSNDGQYIQSIQKTKHILCYFGLPIPEFCTLSHPELGREIKEIWKITKETPEVRSDNRKPIMLLILLSRLDDLYIKMTGGTPEVRYDNSLTLLTFDIWHQTKAMDQWTNGPMTNGPMDQWANWPMGQWTNGPMDQWTNGLMDQWTYVPMV